MKTSQYGAEFPTESLLYRRIQKVFTRGLFALSIAPDTSDWTIDPDWGETGVASVFAPHAFTEQEEEKRTQVK